MHLLLDWLARAHADNLAVRLTIRGAFSDDAPDYEARITQQIQQLNLESVVEFKGFIADPDLVYDGIDIVVVPSEIPDPLPRSVMEAMARKIPVMGYPAGGIGEIILDYETGFMVHDSESFTKALKFTIQNPDKTEIIRQAGLNHIRNNFSMTRLHQKMNEIYKHLKFKAKFN